jgi:hypothetical protein
MISGAYLRQQAEILIAMSRATFDLGVAARLRAMAAELQVRAAEQEDERGDNEGELQAPGSEWVLAGPINLSVSARITE